MIELPPFESLALSLHHSPGTQALLVGSGLSSAAGIPTGWGITIDLIKQLAVSQGVTEHENWEVWFRETYDKQPNYSELVNAVALTADERREILHKYIVTTDDGQPRSPTEAHHAIARLVKSKTIRVIVTTNFDKLIEKALGAVGIDPTVIASDDAISGAKPLVHSDCTVIKVHGDYLDNRIRNTEEELADYSPAMNGLLGQVFDNFGLVVVGWSGEWDAALRGAILRAPTRRYPFYWAARGEIGGNAQDLLNHCGGRSFTIDDANKFFSQLDNRLQALRHASRPHPQTVATAIALAKRYCRDDKYAMEWAEFLHAEVEKIRGYVNGSEYPTIRHSKDTLNEITSTFILLTEIIRKACLICGRWGTDKANQAVIRVIRDLNFADISRANSPWHNALQKFAATICFYWNLVGLIDRGDWHAIKALFLADIKSIWGTLNFVSALPPTAYEEVQWDFLAVVDRQIAPASDYIYDKLKDDAQYILANEARADELFDQAELFITLESAHQRKSVWIVRGRFLYKRYGRMWNEELTRIERLPDSDPIYLGGLLGGSHATAQHTIEMVRDFFNTHGIGR